MHRNALFADSIPQPQGLVGNGFCALIVPGILEPLRQGGVGSCQLSTMGPDRLE
jgi:hypothetical protein